MQYGSHGPNVKKVQTALINAGFSCGSSGADGIFGKDTLVSVKEFQEVQDIETDGIVGPITIPM